LWQGGEEICGSHHSRKDGKSKMGKCQFTLINSTGANLPYAIEALEVSVVSGKSKVNSFQKRIGSEGFLKRERGEWLILLRGFIYIGPEIVSYDET